MGWWGMHRAGYGDDTTPGDHHEMIVESICALLFNAMGYLHEKEKQGYVIEPDMTPEPMYMMRPGLGIGVDDVENPTRITYMDKNYVLEAPDESKDS